MEIPRLVAAKTSNLSDFKLKSCVAEIEDYEKEGQSPIQVDVVKPIHKKVTAFHKTKQHDKKKAKRPKVKKEKDAPETSDDAFLTT